MFEELKENFINLITSRVFVVIIALVCFGAVLINRVFNLQIVHGEEYLDSFQTRILREKTIKGSRGCIYDRNGNLLAYNELAYNVTIEDVYEPYLVQIGFLARTLRGRVPMPPAYQHLGFEWKE